MIIAVDGPAASGKGTVARALAKHYGLPHLDTGLLYRAVAENVRRLDLDLAAPADRQLGEVLVGEDDELAVGRLVALRDLVVRDLLAARLAHAAVLDPATSYGTGLPTGATVLWLGGAGPNMKPERSENWTISAEIKPAALDALSATFSYFNFDYTNRVATPISSSAGILDNPIYSSLVTLSPTAALLQAEISGATVGLQNAAGQPYDPADVVALVDTRDRNVARQNFHGINLAVRYLARLPHNRSLDFTLDGTWIASDQQLLAGLPYVDLAGTIFNPPHLRARAGVSYSTDMLSLSGYANLSSHLTDNRTAAVAEFAGPSTFDLSAQFKGGNGFELGATISNLFNQKPKTIVTASAYQTPFDTTNYSPLGRFVSVSVRKSW